jgi:hypothetical protein
MPRVEAYRGKLEIEKRVDEYRLDEILCWRSFRSAPYVN